MGLWTILVSSLSLVFLLVCYVKRKQRFWRENGIRSPPFKFGVGHSLDRFISKGSVSETFRRYYEQSTDDIVGLYFFTEPATLVRSMDLLKRIMISDFDHFSSRGVYHNEKDDPASAHLFSLDGAKWRNLRTKLTPTFTSGKMKMMFPIIVGISKQFAETFEEAALAHPNGLDIKDLSSRFTTDVIGNCAFGIECNSLKEPNNNAFRLINEGSLRRTLWKIGVLHFAQNFPDLARKLGVCSTSKELNAFYMNMVQAALENRRKDPQPRNDFMNILLQMHENPKSESERITLNEIVGQSFLFFIAGFETSSSTMTFALYELAKNPKIQEQAVDHINTVLGRHNNELTYECLQELDFLERVIQETLRKFPAVPTLVRKVTKDYKVPGSELVLPKGLLNIIPVMSIHMDPEYYEEPEKFKPQRFEAEEVKKRATCAYLPFGEGPRVCPGLRFGVMQAKIGLVALLTNFRFSPTERTQEPLVFDKLSSLLSPKGGIFLKVEKRLKCNQYNFK